MLLDLPDVPPHRLPASDLPRIFLEEAAPEVVAAIPLEPAARILGRDPTLLAPDPERLARIDAEEIERGVAALGREPGAAEPVGRKFASAVGHVLAAEHAQAQHLLGRELRLELGVEVPAHGRRQPIAITPLHHVSDEDRARLHRRTRVAVATSVTSGGSNASSRACSHFVLDETGWYCPT